LPFSAERSPKRRRLTTLFVDIAGSTSLLIDNAPEVVLEVVQRFMRLVTEIASVHAGTVKDFEGDGALLYVATVEDGVRAALAIQKSLADGRCDIACGDGPGIAARMSVTVGDVVVGAVGSSARRGIALIGPSVNIGARLLKHAALGTIIASGEAIKALRQDAPLLADEFRLMDTAFAVAEADGMTITTYVVPAIPGVEGATEPVKCSLGAVADYRAGD
jgi:class 3 adenylate cyclase